MLFTMIYKIIVLLIWIIFSNCESLPTVSFDPNVTIKDIDKNIIDKHSIMSCPDEEAINLTGLKIHEIPIDLVKSKFIKAISFDSNNITILPTNIFDDTPNLKCLNLARNEIPIEQLKLKHDGLNTLILDHQRLLEVLDVSLDEHLMEVGFANLENLSWKGINHDFIYSFLIKFPKLSKLDLSESNLQYMEKDISALMPNLREIHLERNNIKNLSLEHAERIEALYLDENPIEVLSIDSMYKNIKILSLSGCWLSAVTIHLRSLIAVDLSHNQIDDVFTEIFENSPLLENLNLSHNRLLTFPYLFNLNHLRKLSLSYNLIGDITKPVTFNSLKTLNLRGNRIRNIHEITFSNLTVLEELDLSENELKSLPQGWNGGMKMLRYLNLQSNKFLSIKHMMIHPLLNLRELYVKYNHFSSIDLNTLQYVPQKCTVYVV